MRRLTLLFAAFAALASALNPIEVERQNFVDKATGKRFEIVGVDYQPGGEGAYDPDSGKDVLSDRDTCIRDAALMQQLGINTLRVYNLNPEANHDECVSIFNYVGIYLILDVNSPLEGESLNRADPVGSYKLNYLKRVFSMIEAFRGYPNLIGFFSANEVIQPSYTFKKDPPYLRAVNRDMKEYIAARNDRKIPVGYSAADVRDVLVDTSNYLQCVIDGDETDMTRSDFFALNSYSWCGDATFESSTYNELAQDFADTTIPVFFSEFGCFIISPRIFTEVPVLYSNKMITWSGGLVYVWSEPDPPDDSGLVIIKPGGDIEIKQDYDNLQSQYNKLNFDLLEARNVTARNLKPPTCGPSLISGQFSSDWNIPQAPAGTEELIQNGVDVQPGKIIPVTKTVVDVIVTSVSGQTTNQLTITRAFSANKPKAAQTTTEIVSKTRKPPPTQPTTTTTTTKVSPTSTSISSSKASSTSSSSSRSESSSRSTSQSTTTSRSSSRSSSQTSTTPRPKPTPEPSPTPKAHQAADDAAGHVVPQIAWSFTGLVLWLFT